MERFSAGSGLSIVTKVPSHRDRGRRVLPILMASLLLATYLTIAAGVSHQVLAVGCYGHTCEGKSPIAMGCTADEDPWAVDGQPAQHGIPGFQIFHYFSARCQASWNVTVSNSPGLAGAFDVLEFSDSKCTHLVSWEGTGIYFDGTQTAVGSPMADETKYWVYAATNPDWEYTSWPQFPRTQACI